MSAVGAYASFPIEAVRWALDGWGAVADGGRRLVMLDGEGCDDAEVLHVWRPGEREEDSVQYLAAAEHDGTVLLSEFVRVTGMIEREEIVGAFGCLADALRWVTPLDAAQEAAAGALAERVD